MPEPSLTTGPVEPSSTTGVEPSLTAGVSPSGPAEHCHEAVYHEPRTTGNKSGRETTSASVNIGNCRYLDLIDHYLGHLPKVSELKSCFNPLRVLRFISRHETFESRHRMFISGIKISPGIGAH
jgi:hypothetical protein